MSASSHDRGEQQPAATPWAELEALAAQEAALVADGRFDDLSALYDRRGALLAALPRPLPPEALEPLRRALAAQRGTATALEVHRELVTAELGRLHRGRAGVQGYARSADVRS